jgi:large subunit ribosomal protein L18
MTSRAGQIRRARRARHERVRERVRGSAARPRLAVYRSLSHIHAQVIDDGAGRTLAAASSLELRGTKAKKTELAAKVGELIGQRAKEKGIEGVVFDRGGALYHGRVKALADAARKTGLRF